jgi:hypothetical protein
VLPGYDLYATLDRRVSILVAMRTRQVTATGVLTPPPGLSDECTCACVRECVRACVCVYVIVIRVVCESE